MKMNKIKHDFWITSGWHLLNNNKGLVPTEDYMRAYFLRPELELVEESCENEKKLRAKLIDSPFL